jgi:hypothetical protein
MSPELENIINQVQQLDSQEQHQLLDRLTTQSKSVDQSDNPWLAIAGNLVDDPFFDEYIAAIDQYRKELDQEESDDEKNIAA